MFTMISDIYPKNAVGSMTGLTGFTAAVGGALSASFVGLILDATGSYFLIFAIASMVYILNWLIIKIFIPEIKPIAEYAKN
jgi:ACS family hexuronate transporter-like MFS transporter